jgi:hypothetical protein
MVHPWSHSFHSPVPPPRCATTITIGREHRVARVGADGARPERHFIFVTLSHGQTVRCMPMFDPVFKRAERVNPMLVDTAISPRTEPPQWLKPGIIKSRGALCTAGESAHP